MINTTKHAHVKKPDINSSSCLHPESHTFDPNSIIDSLNQSCRLHPSAFSLMQLCNTCISDSFISKIRIIGDLLEIKQQLTHCLTKFFITPSPTRILEFMRIVLQHDMVPNSFYNICFIHIRICHNVTTLTESYELLTVVRRGLLYLYSIFFDMLYMESKAYGEKYVTRKTRAKYPIAKIRDQ